MKLYSVQKSSIVTGVRQLLGHANLWLKNSALLCDVPLWAVLVGSAVLY